MKKSWAESFARVATCWTGSTAAFLLACLVVAVWLGTGPLFGFSDTWQLVINTGTTIITFLMVFLIQRAQNNDSRALHLKLDELIAAVRGASSRLLNVEDLSEDQLIALHQRYAALAESAASDRDPTTSHSIEELERPAPSQGRTPRRQRRGEAEHETNGDSSGSTGAAGGLPSQNRG
jgi:low affinity Fe/Cu permease